MHGRRACPRAAAPLKKKKKLRGAPGFHATSGVIKDHSRKAIVCYAHRFVLHAVAATRVLRVHVLTGTSSDGLLLYSAKAMTPMTVAMMMFTALSLIESASIPASLP